MNTQLHPAGTGRLAAAVLVAAVLAAAVGLGAATSALAAPATTRPVEQSGAMPADGRVSVENVLGSVTVTGWDKAEIRVTGTLGADVKELEFHAGERSEVRVVLNEGKHETRDADAAADLTIQVPRGCRLEVEVVAARVDVSGLAGDIGVEAVSGDVDVRGACRRLEVASVSGSVAVDGAGTATEISTVSGSLKVRCDDAALEIETVTGTATVDCASLRSLKANTVNGAIAISGRPAAGASIEAESVNGSLTLAVPADVSAAFEVTTFNGDIRNAFGQKAERTDQYAPGEELKFTNGTGEADINLNTLNGKIEILKN